MTTKPEPKNNAETEAKVQQLTMLENNLQGLGMQRQQYQGQMVETESALEELEKSGEAYKIIGNIMARVDKEKLKKDLNTKKEAAQFRIKSLDKQEETLREKAKGLQEEILKNVS